MTFEEWWTNNYKNTFPEHMKIIELSFKEVAQHAWTAARNCLVAEALAESKVLAQHRTPNEE